MNDGETMAALLRFMFDRLPKTHEPANDRPCLAEEWFVRDARPVAPNWLDERDLRRVWRVARLQRMGLYPGSGDPRLLLHQMSDFMEALFANARDAAIEQRAEKLFLSGGEAA